MSLLHVDTQMKQVKSLSVVSNSLIVVFHDIFCLLHFYCLLLRACREFVFGLYVTFLTMCLPVDLLGNS